MQSFHYDELTVTDKSSRQLARETHWPQLKATYPLLGVCAWLVLSAMNANVITERANSIGRLVLTHLRGRTREEDTVRLVLAYYAYRAARKAKKQRAELLLHRDMLAIQALPVVAVDVPVPVGGPVAVVVADSESDSDPEGDAALPRDELEDIEIDAVLRNEA